MKDGELETRTNRKCLLAMAACGLLASEPAAAGELAHFQPSFMNVRDFLVPGEAGFYYLQYNYAYDSDTLTDRGGDEVDALTIGSPLGRTTIKVDVNLDVYAVAPAFIWVTDWKLLGARYAGFISPNLASGSVPASLGFARDGRFFDQDFDVSLEREAGGVGDMYVQPLWLGWTGKHYDASVAYGFWVPAGSEGVGLEFWEQQLQAAGAWYPWEDRRMAIMLAGTYELAHDMQGKDLDPGDRFNLNWGVSQFLPLKAEAGLLAELGIRGYAQWQIDSDSGDDVRQVLNTTLNAKDEIYGAGLQAGITYVPGKAALNISYMWEFGAESRFEGEWVGLSFVKGF